MQKIGIGITDFTIASISYPEEVQRMQTKAAAQSMVGDMNRYQQMGMVDAMTKGGGSGVASDMMQMQMGMAMGQQMANQMNQMNQNSANGGVQPSGGSGVNFCPNCGTKVSGAKFCPNCGTKLC